MYLGNERSSYYGVSFNFILRPMSLITIHCRTDAALVQGGIGGYIHKQFGTWFQVNWNQVQLYYNRDIVWRELAAVFVLVHCLAPFWSQKVIRIDVDNISVKYMIMNLRSKLSRPDLQILINHICKLQIKFKFNLWMEWLSTKQNYTADNLSRFVKNPFKHCNIKPAAYPIKMASYALQLASNMSKNYAPKTDCIWIDDNA